MKHLLICMILLVSLTACASTASDKGGCSKDGEVCIKVRAEEPISWGKPVKIVITVTSEKDISDLGVSLITSPKNIVVQKTADIEQGTVAWENQSGVDWIVDIKAIQPVILSRELYLPSEEGFYEAVVYAITPQLQVGDSLSIYLTRERGTVYLSGTSIPIIEGPLPTMNPSKLATLQAMPTKTSRSTLTPKPPTPILPLQVSPTPPAYPPPATIPPTNTSQPYP